MIKPHTIFRILGMLAVCCHVQLVQAGIGPYFVDENGDTNWHHIANFSSGVLILALSAAVIGLYFSRRKTARANAALEEIRADLAQRVQERTASLEATNRLLTFSEAYIKDILDSMPLMLVGINQEFEITQWNRGAEKITGVSAERAMGVNLWQAYPTITLSPDQVSKVLETGKATTIKHSQRGQYYFDITIYPLSAGVETGLVILLDDVTQRILAENMLIQRDKMSSMGELASTMAHDIDVPLDAILEDLAAIRNLVKDGELAQQMEPFLNDAMTRGVQASRVVSNLLDFSRSRGDQKRLAYIPEVIEHSYELAADVLIEPSGLRFRDITVERQYAEDLSSLPSYVAELQQVFLSIFRHACYALGKFRGRENFKPLIRVEVKEAYDALWIKVQHNGRGLTPSEQQYLFEPYFVSSGSASEDHEAGRRLSFSYFIITEHHQGQLAVTSDLELGTTFHIQLPLE